MMANTKSLKDTENWRKLWKQNNVYIGGACALLYALDYEDYSNGQEIGDYVSIFFIVKGSGKDKKELLVFGKETIENIGSLPLKYYKCSEPKVNISAIATYLTTWNESLRSKNETIRLILSFTDKKIEHFSFSNIELIYTNMGHAIKMVNNIAKCFKYHYRKLQIVKNIVNDHDSRSMSFLEYINMISAAWHNVSSTYVHSSLNASEEKTLSLSDWCTSYNVPLKCLSNLKPLDNFVCYDNKLLSVNMEDLENQKYDDTQFHVSTVTSEMEALQAMKRILTYLQEEEADPVVMKSALVLEDHLERDTMSKIDKLFSAY